MRRYLGFGAAAVCLAGTGCGVDRGAWDHVPVVEAWLERFDLSALSVVIGTMQGDALLVYTEPNGNAGSVPVHLGGGMLGVAFDMSADPEGHDGWVEIDLGRVDAPTVGDLFGTYHGTGSSGAMIAGGSRRRMQNGAGASFREDHFALGLALNVGYQWVTIREGGNDGQTDESTFPTYPPPPPTDTGTPPPVDTGANGDTGSVVDTASGQASSGCNPDEDDDDEETTAPAPAEEPSSSSSCDDSSGCVCSTGSAAPLGFTGVLLFLRFRRAGSGASTRSSRGSSAAR